MLLGCSWGWRDSPLPPLLPRWVLLMRPQGGVQCVKLGDQVVEWGPGFRLYMTTKLRNPHYPPEVWPGSYLVRRCSRLGPLQSCDSAAVGC
jgi:hypothetical protein